MKICAALTIIVVSDSLLCCRRRRMDLLIRMLLMTMHEPIDVHVSLDVLTKKTNLVRIRSELHPNPT